MADMAVEVTAFISSIGAEEKKLMVAFFEM
jgi:hypothetical protein